MYHITLDHNFLVDIRKAVEILKQHNGPENNHKWYYPSNPQQSNKSAKNVEIIVEEEIEIEEQW